MKYLMVLHGIIIGSGLKFGRGEVMPSSGSMVDSVYRPLNICKVRFSD